MPKAEFHSPYTKRSETDVNRDQAGLGGEQSNEEQHHATLRLN